MGSGGSKSSTQVQPPPQTYAEPVKTPAPPVQIAPVEQPKPVEVVQPVPQPQPAPEISKVPPNPPAQLVEKPVEITEVPKPVTEQPPTLTQPVIEQKEPKKSERHRAGAEDLYKWATNGSMADAREVGSVLFDPPKPGPNPYAKDFNPSEHDYEKDKLVKPAVQAPVPVVPPQQKQILPVAIPQHQYPVAGPLAHPNAVIPYQPRVAPFPNQPGHEKFLRPGGSPPPHNYSQTINQYERDLPPGHPALNSRNPYGPPPPPKPKFRPPRYDEFGRLQDLSKDLHNLSHTFDADHIEGRHHIQNNPAYNPALATGPKQPIAAMGHQRPPEEPHVPFRFLQNNPNLHLNNPYYKGAQPIAAPRQF